MPIRRSTSGVQGAQWASLSRLGIGDWMLGETIGDGMGARYGVVQWTWYGSFEVVRGTARHWQGVIWGWRKEDRIRLEIKGRR